MFEIDECRNFFQNSTHIFYHIYRRPAAKWSNHQYHYFWIRTGYRNKKFYRIFDNFYIERK